MLGFEGKREKQTNADINRGASSSLKSDYDKQIRIHVMPERFRGPKHAPAGAKTTGIIVLISGMVILLTLVLAAYFFVIKPRLENQAADPGNAAKKTEASQPVTPVPVPLAPAKGGDDEGQPVRPEENASADMPATTSPTSDGLEGDGLGTTTVPDVAATGTEATTATATPPVIFSDPPPDSDGDGLSDKEEALLGSDPTLVDSDGDGYRDSAELINLYDPAGPEKLADSLAIKLYKNPTFGYGFLHPAAWQPTKLSGEDSVLFDTGDFQFFQAIVQPNTDRLGVREWYAGEFDVPPAENRLLVRPDWEGVLGEDALTVYLTDNDREYIMTLSYSPGASRSSDYKGIFQMMVASFGF